MALTLTLTLVRPTSTRAAELSHHHHPSGPNPNPPPAPNSNFNPSPLCDPDPNPPPPQMLAAMSPDEFETINLAAARLQRRWRECQQKVLVEEYTRAAYSQPDLEKAKKHAVGFLPKDRHGHLFPLTAPLKVGGLSLRSFFSPAHAYPFSDVSMRNPF